MKIHQPQEGRTPIIQPNSITVVTNTFETKTFVDQNGKKLRAKKVLHSVDGVIKGWKYQIDYYITQNRSN
jgi:hypothetical protein